ncbi:MAG: HD-GYP domain-containing protein [Anaerovoracaceae bacterium]|jgi:response regulator RpfG family c-di-GMP phosphodiesterase
MNKAIKTLCSQLECEIVTPELVNATQLLLNDFADKVDLQLQNNLMSDMMYKYTELSRNLEESNRIIAQRELELKKYNEQLEELVDAKVREISDSQIATIYALVKLAESRDGDTGAHIERTAQFCRLLAQKLRQLPEYADVIDDEYIENIYRSSPLHDIGKVGIPDAILQKPGKLTPEEYQIMKNHAEIGAKTLEDVAYQYEGNSFLKMGLEIAKGHHEKWDGTGYPKGLSGTDIPLSARIMAIVDVYDALRSKRSYKDSFSHEKSIAIIQEGRGTHFDPLLVDIFVKYQDEFRALYDATT